MIAHVENAVFMPYIFSQMRILLEDVTVFCKINVMFTRNVNNNALKLT